MTSFAVEAGTPAAMPSVVIVIPARYGSTRLPGKPLADIAGKPMVQHVYERACQVSGVQAVLVATDDERVASAVQAKARTIRWRKDLFMKHSHSLLA